MKGKALVIILIMCFGLFGACTQQIVPSSEEGFKVRIAPSGKIVNAVNWDGSPVQYADENRDITKARLAFFEQEGEPSHYFKKVDGKWQKTVWGAGEPDVEKAELMVHVAPDGTISRVTNIDGSEVPDLKSIDFKKVRIATKNTCCYGYCAPGILCCLCRFCPGGRC